MDARFRAPYNAGFTPDLYRAYVSDLTARCGGPVPFRLAETPVFLPPAFLAETERAAREILAQLSAPDRLAAMRAAVPARWDVPGPTDLPTFAILDFAATVGGAGQLVPRLIELQGFPSLIGLVDAQGAAWQAALQRIPELAGPWSCRGAGLSRPAFLELARRVIVGEHEPRSVILLDLDPPSQKTWPDFAVTKALWDVDAVSATALIARRGRLYRREEPTGRELPVERIYYRLVIDEVIAKDVQLPFDLRDDLAVEWSPHPNWFWMWSKYSLPFLDHPAVPATWFVSELGALPKDLSNFVLKPLFSFAGGGVNVTPSAGDITAIPPAQRSNWCLQDKIDYAAVVPAADGGMVKAEIRLMFLRPDGAEQFTLAENLCRLSRGVMIGVDHNKDATWVGSSVGLTRA